MPAPSGGGSDGSGSRRGCRPARPQPRDRRGTRHAARRRPRDRREDHRRARGAAVRHRGRPAGRARSSARRRWRSSARSSPSGRERGTRAGAPERLARGRGRHRRRLGLGGPARGRGAGRRAAGRSPRVLGGRGHGPSGARSRCSPAGIGADPAGASRPPRARPAPPVPPLPDGSGPWTAVVESVGSPRDGDQVARLALAGRAGGARSAVAATLPAFPAVRAGDTVEVRGRLRPPPDDDGYGEYLRRTGAAGQPGRRRPWPSWRHPPGLSLQPMRDAAGDALRLALPEPEAGLAAGILIGLRERVDRDARRGLHDGRREPRRRDLGLEHRDRRGSRGGGAARPVAAASWPSWSAGRSSPTCWRPGRRRRWSGRR